MQELEAFAAAPTVLAYWPMAKEVDIRAVIGPAIAQGKTVCLPRIDWTNGSMEAVRIDSADPPLETLRYGVYEPMGREVVPPGEIAFIIVPGLAFDERGSRLGRGAGYYDTYAARAPEAFRCGVCLSAQVVERIPVDTHDARMHAVVTERARIIV